MKKKIWISAVVAMLVAASPLAVSAQTFSGASDWKAEFDGGRIKSNFSSSDISDAVYQLQPGDSVDITLGIVNSSDMVTDWYISNEVLQSLEDSQSVAEGGAYSYTLTYTDPDGETEILYSSDTVGGETAGKYGEGLHQATDALEDFFFLGNLNVGEKGRIHLTVSLEGETQGNDYQDTLAKLQMNFAVEPEATIVEGEFVRRRAVKTGDNLFPFGVVAVTFAAGVSLIVLAIMKNRKEKKIAASENSNPKKGAEQS